MLLSSNFRSYREQLPGPPASLTETASRWELHRKPTDLITTLSSANKRFTGTHTLISSDSNITDPEISDGLPLSTRAALRVAQPDPRSASSMCASSPSSMIRSLAFLSISSTKSLKQDTSLDFLIALLYPRGYFL